jgi:hypothetical protein
MSFRYGTYYYSLIGHLVENDRTELFRLLSDWIQYNNPNLNNAIDYILEYNDKLPDEFFEKLIEILDKYNKIEPALLCARELIKRKKKERFIL